MALTLPVPTRASICFHASRWLQPWMTSLEPSGCFGNLSSLPALCQSTPSPFNLRKLTLRVQQQRPVNQVQIHIIQPQRLQALLQRELDTRVVCSPDLGHDKDVLALHARVEGLLQTLAHLVLVAVAVGAINQLVAILQGVGDGRLDLAFLALPGAYSRHVSLASIE